MDAAIVAARRAFDGTARPNSTVAQDEIFGPVIVMRPHVYYGIDASVGGYKQSGIAREIGVAGFEEYLQIKSIAIGAS
ncbi:hypothetical protein BST36_28125 [Mycolicibacterium moriokaense]|jgi:acyl-CoA reductase-like NAD-dependent aldehyde dehydrogenase|uniref:Aldehyde dehydrogenase family protein n=1 Tax=Mycolicibacterium moriokaense TaxID=39691 RepID=A0AAD1M3X3_9MYCO|nr:hypothetical protein [Mycolicibacterium moriokaense]MCV7037496.1 hypothetical protein [Mycolicibacterium moriokaense]ORB14751.1 hypothetical protein BST36_28125 [Mycolicibacterium moriokaense]BBW99566.1 hypothetical protein MMOR_05030 [Mycolicibacterium moriokaense]